MLNIYCPDCAQANQYTLSKPTLCGFCGSSLSVGSPVKAAAVASKPTQKPKPQRVAPKPAPETAHVHPLRKRQIQPVQEPELDDEDQGVQEVPQLDHLDYQIVGNRQKLTFKDLAGQSKTGFGARPVENISQSEAMRLFYEEAKGKTAPIDLEDNGE